MTEINVYEQQKVSIQIEEIITISLPANNAICCEPELL